MSLITAAALSAAITAKYPALKEQAGTIDTLQAQGGDVHSIQGQALRSYTQPSGNLLFVRVTVPHLIVGQYVAEGDIVQVTETDAKMLFALDRAVEATPEEVAAAQKASK